MSVYLLPTRSSRRYTGKRPFAINSWSAGSDTDADGNACVHVELNDGSRFTISRAWLKPLASHQGWLGKFMDDIVKADAPVLTLSQERYDRWLSDVRAHRAAKGRN